MFLRVRFVTSSEEVILKDISKLTPIKEVRTEIASVLGINDPSTLMLICKGKILEDGSGLRLLDYRVEDGLIIFAQCRSPESDISKKDTVKNPSSEGEKEATSSEIKTDTTNLEPADSAYFIVGEYVDAQDTDGSWHEAKIEGIFKNAPNESQVDEMQINNVDTDGLIYSCRYGRWPDQVDQLPLHRIRPRALEKINVDKEKLEHSTGNMRPRKYLVNYNVESPDDLGDWFEADIEWEKSNQKTRIRFVTATIFTGIGPNSSTLPRCRITKLNEIYILPERCPKMVPAPGAEVATTLTAAPALRTTLDCRRCFDNPTKKSSCHYCSCVICGSADNNGKLMLCEECAEVYHIYCLDPPLENVPEDDWYCAQCKNDENEVVKAGEANKVRTSKLLNMPSAKTKRRWGGKHSCDGVSKKCTIVPAGHYGAIPGIEVGTCWRYRKQVSSAGVHRPLVCGIHGRANDGAYSIVVAGGYEDDKDEGNTITYTGSGGRDFTGNKRISNQAKDQTLDRNNEALAKNCFSKNSSLNKKGHDAGSNWREGKPVRVVRSWKLKNKYGPEEGFRYDGLYKVVKYWPQKGKEGFVVWQYELRRDDDTPAPWTSKGKALIQQRGLGSIIEPDDGTANANDSDTEEASNDQTLSTPKEKRQKCMAYEIPLAQMELIKKDTKNDAQWQECLEQAVNGSKAFFDKLVDVFTCAICQHVVHSPATLACGHSFCMDCVSRCQQYGHNECASCRHLMDKTKSGEEFEIRVNKRLAKALESLMPGYAKDRERKKQK